MPDISDWILQNMSKKTPAEASSSAEIDPSDWILQQGRTRHEVGAGSTIKDIATQVATGVPQGLLDTIITAGLVGTYPLRRTGLFERLTGETPQETNRAIEELYSAIRPEAKTKLGQMFGDVAEFVAPAGGVSRIVQKPIQRLVEGGLKQRALQTGAGFAGGTGITEGGELTTGQISTDQFIKNMGLSGITGVLFGGAGGIPGKTMSARTARLLGEWGALTQTAPLVTEQRLATPEEALYGTILLGAFKGMEAGLSRLSAHKGTSVEQEKGELFRRARAEGKSPSEVLNKDLTELKLEPVRPLPEEKEVPIAKPQEAQEGQEVVRPPAVVPPALEPSVATKERGLPLQPETPPPPPSALGMEPQPGTTELPGATPKVEPAKTGIGAEALPQAGETTSTTGNIKNGLERADIVNLPSVNIQTKYQPREGLQKEQVEHIVENYDPNLFDPIVVNQEPAGMYVISGHHRLAASKKLGLTEIPAKVLSVPEAEARRLAAQANENRLEHSILEQAKIYEQAKAEGLDTRAIAKRFNKTPFFVENRLLLNGLSPGVKEAVRNNKIPVAHATEFGKAVDRYKWNPAVQDEIFRSIYIPYGSKVTAENFRTILDTFAPQVSVEQLGLGMAVQKTDLGDKLSQFFKTIKALEDKEKAYKTLIRASLKLEESDIPEIKTLLGKREQMEAEIQRLREQINQAVQSAGFGAEKFKPPTTTADVGGYAKTLPLYPEPPTKFKKGDTVYLRTPKGATSSLYEIEDVHATGGGNLYKIKGVLHGVKDWVSEDKLILQPDLFGKKPPSTTADVGGYAKTEAPLKGIELPEIVELAQEINQGKYPQVKKRLRAFRGKVLGVFYGKGEEIKLRADIFKDPQLAQRVLAHEIGHLVDWLPDKTLARGNILGRIATLKKHLKHFYEKLSPDQFKKITEELRALSLEWKPFDPKANPKFARYRFSSKELYADAVSVLVNDPALFKAKAPTFHDAFFKYLERKPEVKSAYEEIQSRLRGEGVIPAREARMHAATARGEEKLLQLKPEEPTRRDYLQATKKAFVDVDIAILEKVKELRRRGLKLSPEDNPELLLAEVRYTDSRVKQYLRDIDGKIREPLNAIGITDEDLGNYLLYNRIMTERASIANPLGHTPETAKIQLEAMRTRLGPEKYDALEKAQEDFWRLRNQYIIPVIEESKTFTPELITLLKNNKNYATFLVNKYIEGTYGKSLGPKIYKQIGTLEEVANPFMATIMKDTALVRASARKLAAEKSISMLKEHFGDEIQPAETQWNGKYQEPVEPKDPKKGLVIFTHEGKVQGWYVDKSIAETFSRDPIEASLITQAFSAMTRPLKEIFVSKNPFFMMWNIQRDIKAFAKNVPEANLYQAIKYTAKAVPDAWQDVFRGKSTQTVAQMYKDAALIVGRIWASKDISPNSQLERMMIEYAQRPGAYESQVMFPFKRAWDFLDKPGQFIERLTKIGGYKYLKDLQRTGKKDISNKEIAHLVRTRIGSPDFRRVGQLVSFYNNLFLFSNAGKEGWRASLESYKDGPSAYAWKTMKYDILPKLMMYAGATGLLGVGYQKMFRDIPEHDKANYLTIPIGTDANNKTVYLIQPHDFTGQLVAGMLWKSLLSTKDRDITQVFDYLQGGTPYTSLNPLLQVAGAALQYARGRNPYDAWRGEEVIPKTEFEAGGRPAMEILGKHFLNTLGSASVFHRFKHGDIEGIKSELEGLIGTPVVGRAVERFLRVSNRGLAEEFRGAGQEARTEQAKEILVARGALTKMVQGKALSANEIDALARHTSLITPRLQTMLAKKYGDPFWQAFLSAGSNAEKTAILNKRMELQKQSKAVSSP